MGGTDDRGRAVCAPCAAGVTRTCPDCGLDVPGAGRAPCHACAARRRGRARLGLLRTGLTRPWVRDLFDGFCEALLWPEPRGDVVARVEAAGRVFARIDLAFPTSADVDVRRLRSLLGTAGLRRAENAVAHVCRALDLSWDDDAGGPVRWDGSGAAPGAGPDADRAAMLHAYASHLADGSGRPLAPRTRRLYVRAAHELLDGARAARRALPDVRDVRRMLRRTPGARASLGPFLTWLRVSGRAEVELPRRRRPDRRAAEGRAIASARLIVRALAEADDPIRGRALLAACVSLLFAVPLGRVLALRAEDASGDGPVVLSLDGQALALTEGIATAFERWAGRGRSGLLFPGRTGLRPASTSGVRHHVAAVLGRRRAASRGPGPPA